MIVQMNQDHYLQNIKMAHFRPNSWNIEAKIEVLVTWKFIHVIPYWINLYAAHHFHLFGFSHLESIQKILD